MKQVFLVRHAKSSWGGIGLSDFDRPLNERGKKDAPVMAQRLMTRKIKIDAFVSSPAKRAKSTCKAFCKVYKTPEEEIIFMENLYHAGIETFYDVIQNLDDRFKNVAIFSHNPGITDFINTLCDGVRTDNMPTCSIFGAACDISSWKEFQNTPRTFLLFDYPKAGT